MNNYKDNPIAAAYVAMNEKKVVERASWVPEEITDEGAAEFMGAAANAAKKGDKTFKFGDKEYKVTMKKATADAINKKESVKEEDEVEVCEECGKVHEGSCESGDKKEVEEVAEPEAKGEKAFKDMHTKNTKKSGEKDDGTVVKEEVEIDEISTKTLANYIKKSEKDAEVQGRRYRKTNRADYPDVSKDAQRRFSTRTMGRDLAVSKLINKSADKGIEKKRVKRSDKYPKAEGPSRGVSISYETADIQEGAVKVKPEKFKGNRDETAVAKRLEKAGYVYGRTPDMLAFETPGFFNPKNGNKVILMRRGKQFAVSKSNGSTVQRPTDTNALDQWLIRN